MKTKLQEIIIIIIIIIINVLTYSDTCNSQIVSSLLSLHFYSKFSELYTLRTPKWSTESSGTLYRT